MAHPLEIESVELRAGGVEARVRLTDPALRRTSAVSGVVARALRRYPGLVRHRCESGRSHGVLAELEDTEMAHLLEHLALEILVSEGHPRSMQGRTSWDSRADGSGAYRVWLGCPDAQAADAAFRAAATVVSELCDEQPTP